MRFPLPMSRAITALIFALLVIAGTVLLWTNARYQGQLERQETSPQAGARGVVGQLRPDFVLPDRLGLAHSVSEWGGRVLVLNFWASWCQPCRRELPRLVELQQRYGGKGAQFVGIAIDEPTAVDAFLSQNGLRLNYPSLIEESQGIAVAKAYGNDLGVLPYTVVVARDGRIASVQFGELSIEELEAVLAPLL